jgi:hypothetical protein
MTIDLINIFNAKTDIFSNKDFINILKTNIIEINNNININIDNKNETNIIENNKSD